MSILRTIGIIVAVIVVLLILKAIFKKTPERYYKKARKCHQLGEKYHQQGDEDLAKEYYAESKNYRQKAQDLENVV